MKKNLLFIVALLALSTFVFSEVKIGIINPQGVLQTSIKGKEAIERLRSLNLSKQKRYEAMQKEIETLEKDILSPALNADTREKKNSDLQNKRIDIKRFAEDAQKDSMASQQKEFESLQRELMPIIEKIAKSGGFSVILDLNTAGVTYFEPSIDITNEVIKAYDAQAAAPAAKK
jgi:Skp family chaperone for outer membrane proteins